MFKDKQTEELARRLARMADELSVLLVEPIELLENTRLLEQEDLVEISETIEKLHIGKRSQALYETLIRTIKDNSRIDQTFEEDLGEIILESYIAIEDTLLVVDRNEFMNEKPKELNDRLKRKKELLERARQELHSVADIFA